MTQSEFDRLKAFASQWEGSDAEVTLSPSDVRLVKELGGGGGKIDTYPATIVGKELFALTEKAPKKLDAPDASEPADVAVNLTGPAAEATTPPETDGGHPGRHRTETKPESHTHKDGKKK